MTEACNQAATNATKNVNNVKSKKGYASGTNYVKEDGYYTVNEGNETETFLRRGTVVKNGMQTRQENKTTDTTETNSLLKTLISEFNDMKRAYQEQPRQMLRLSREGGL